MTTDVLLGYFHTGVLGVFPGGLVWGYITGVQLGDYWDTSWGILYIVLVETWP